MAGTALTSKACESNANPIMNKAIGAVTTASKVFSVANGIRQAIPVVQGLVRAAPGLMARVAPLVFWGNNKWRLSAQFTLQCTMRRIA